MRKLIYLCCVIAAMSSLALWSCQKEESQNTLNTPSLNTTNQSSISLEEAKKYFEQVQTVIPTSNLSGDGELLTPSCVTPNWYLATKSYYKTKREIIVVPLYDKLEIEDCPQGIVNLIFFKDKDNKVVQRFQFFLPSDEYAHTHPSALDIKTFTGHTFLINENGDVGHSYIIKNGKPVEAFDMRETNAQTGTATSRDPIDWLRDWLFGSQCYNFGGKKHIKHSKSVKKGKNGKGGGSNGGVGEDSNSTLVWSLDDIDYYDDSDNYNENGGGPGFQNYFDDGILGVTNVKKAYNDECGKGTNDSNIPFLFTIEALRQVSDNDENFEGYFGQALSYYYQLKAMGQNVSLGKVIKDYIINPKNGISAPTNLTTKNVFDTRSVAYKNVLKSVMKQATDQYSQCVKTYGLQVSVGNAPVELPNDQACSCLGDFSVEDGLKEFLDRFCGEKGVSTIQMDDYQKQQLGSNNLLLKYLEYLSDNKDSHISWEEYRLFVEANEAAKEFALPLNIGPTLNTTAGTRLCPTGFVITQMPAPRQNESTCGFQGLRYSFTTQSGTVITQTMKNMFINVPNIPTSTGVSQAVAITNSINSALQQLQTNIANGVPPPIDAVTGQNSDPNSWFMILIGQALRANWNGIALGPNINMPSCSLLATGWLPVPPDNMGRSRLGVQSFYGTVFSNPTTNCN